MKSHRMRLRNWSIICCLFAFLLTIIGGEASEFSADMLIKTTSNSHSIALKGKVFVKGKNTRTEEYSSEKKLTNIEITRYDKRLIWVIEPQKHIYDQYVMNVNPNIGNKDVSKSKKELLKREEVNGYMCEKYKITQMVFGRKLSTILWYSKKLNYKIKSITEELDGTT